MTNVIMIKSVNDVLNNLSKEDVISSAKNLNKLKSKLINWIKN